MFIPNQYDSRDWKNSCLLRIMHSVILNSQDILMKCPKEQRIEQGEILNLLLLQNLPRI